MLCATLKCMKSTLSCHDGEFIPFVMLHSKTSKEKLSDAGHFYRNGYYVFLSEN